MPLRLLDVREGEWPSVAPALSLAFLTVGAQTLATIAADTLFVSAFDLGRLSGFYVVTSLLRVGVSLGYGAVAERAPGVRAETGLLALTASATLAAGLLAHGAAPPLLYVLCVVLQLLPTLLPLVAMNAAMDCFHARQAKRLLPLVAAAATLGAIAVGGVAQIVAVTLGTPALLFLSAALCLGAAPLPAALAARAAATDAPKLLPARTSQAPVAPKTAGFFASIAEGLRDLGSVPVVRIFAVSALLAAAATNFVDFAFKAALKARYGRDEMAAFLGSVNLVTEAIVLFAQLFVTSRFLGRFGIRAALQARPATLLVLAPAVALPGVAPATAAKLAETSLRMAISGAVSDLLLAPTPSRMRTRVKLFAKSAAAPVGSLVSGLLLALFGDAGPPRAALAALLFVTAALSVVALLGVRRAYTSALAEALGEGRVTLDVSPATAELLRGELRRLLESAVRAGDDERAARLVSVMSDRLFRLEDLAPALAPGAPAATTREATRAALRLVRTGEGDALLAMLPPSDDDALERDTLAAARATAAKVARARIDRALDRGRSGDGEVPAGLWAEALCALAADEKDAAVKQLRKAALGPDSPRRAAAIRALGDLGEGRAETEILRGLGSNDPTVYAEAARAAVRIQAAGAVPTLISNLETGVQVRSTMRALALAGPSAVAALLAALPTTRGEGAFRTAVAGGRGIAGTVRAARILARLGPGACQRALDRFGELGFRARSAVARALATVPPETARALDRGRIEGAMSLTLAYGEMLLRAYPAARPGLLKDELRHRIDETSHRILDLASVSESRDLIARARAALTKDARDRGNALELLENVLPSGFAARVVTLLEQGEKAAPPGPAPAFDGWLAKCEKFDAAALRSDDPMLGVLEKLVTLREAPLFRGLSGEELYPVGEIAQIIVHAPGDLVVRQGDPGDALFVVSKGTLRVQKDDKVLSEISRGAVFGEMALLDGAPRAATVEAVTDAELLRVPRSEFEALLDESPEIARAVIRLLLGYVRGQR
ncbi:cAMP protein kinase regulatory chain [Minicystis rosea]|nr:cAMP protein kinase regulatory chain [Minicystis rosea]